jgi:hypothetical protein
MIQFVLTVVKDEGKDDEAEERISGIIDDQFADFIDGIMQDYPNTDYQCNVDWNYNNFGNEGEE